jgi:nucleoside-diphosphate-sugar epimerase
MKKVLVTGASGFIGNYVVAELLKDGFPVIATASSKKSAIGFDWFKKVDFVPLNFKDYNDSVNYYNYFNQPDILIHLAWEGLPNYKELFHFEENLPNHYKFLKNLVINGLKDITITGTCLEYGMREGVLHEDMVTNPTTPYALAKDCLRKFLQQLTAIHSFNLKWVRLFYMYGKGQNPKSLFSQLEKAIENNEPCFNMSGGEQIRDYLPVETVSKYIKTISLQNKVTGIVNCCSGRPTMLKALVQEFINNKGSKISLNLGHYPYTDYEPMAFWGSDVKLKLILKNE